MISIVPFLHRAVLNSLIGFFAGFLFLVSAQAEVFTPDFCKSVNENQEDKNEYLELLHEYKNDNVETFALAFENTKQKYHQDVNVFFNTQMDLLSSEVFGNNESNAKVCSPFVHSQSTSSLQVSREMMKQFQKYECALLVYIQKPIMNGDEITFVQGISTLTLQQTSLRKEISRSFKTLELTIHMYSEMRMWYPVHRDLQCLASQMKTYNKALREFVDEIVRMPVKFFNYGSRYQH